MLLAACKQTFGSVRLVSESSGTNIDHCMWKWLCSFAAAANDLQIRRISIPDSFCPILILDKEPVFRFKCW